MPKNSSEASGGSWLNHIARKISPEPQNVNQQFFAALQKEDLKRIKKIVEKQNFDVNTTYCFNTPLSIAINLKDKAIANYLISKNANPNLAMGAAII
ncbi:MAG TPA: ankyrin repeat domain-containing protein [Rickettsia endosymbiont of Pyrocoelia pectoralis]|nr:ankyrin repeat domain-containing protein [Rickettsia endosymbiont of Pyrocoelia pectoralis]